MAIYAISDIHGYYDEFIGILTDIKFSEDDELILLGDYIDRGPKSYEMLQWIVNSPDNVLLLKGNHELEFSMIVNLMLNMAKNQPGWKDRLNKSYFAENQYNAIKSVAKATNSWFDVYDTISNMFLYHNISFKELLKWKDIIDQMPYYYKKTINNRKHVFVHAAYTESRDIINELKYDSFEKFYLYGRDDSYRLGGIENGVIISGHNPTIIEGDFTYNNGLVFRYYNEILDCLFYDIDCGNAFRVDDPNAKLACLCIDNKKVYYR